MADRDNDAVAAHWVYYAMSRKSCANWSDSNADLDRYRKIGVEAGYPVALRYYGFDLIQGFRIKKNASDGVAYMERARDAGLGQAAAELAYLQSTGQFLPVNKAEAIKNYRFALKEGLSPGSRKALENAIPADVVRAAKSSGPMPQKDPRLFAALAVQNSDGTFGYAFDHQREAEARDVARAECERNGGTDCKVKLVLRGPACIAYSSNPGSTAFGWGYNKDQGTAQSRAAQECQDRNGAACASAAWSCNTRTSQATEVLFEAENARTATETTLAGCMGLVILSCYKDGRSNDFQYQSPWFNLDYPGCNQDHPRQITYKYKKNDYEQWGKPVSAAGKKVLEPYVRRMQKLAPRYASECRPNRITVLTRYYPDGIDVSKNTPGNRFVKDPGGLDIDVVVVDLPE